MPTNNCSVRDGRPEDLPRLIELLKSTGLFWATGDSEASFHKKMMHDSKSIIVLETEEKIIGMIFIIYDPWASLMCHLAIDPEYQGRGLGHLLAEEAERRLETRGTTSINGYVVETNKNSLSFLTKRHYAQFPRQLVLMEKALNKKR